MNELDTVYAFLNQTIRQDSQLCLAQTVAWLDPLYFTTSLELEYYDDEAGILQNALIITRNNFPEIYAEAVNKIRSGASHQSLDSFIWICEGISAYGINLDNLEYMPYGIPLPAYGVEFDDPEFYNDHPKVLPVLDCFGLKTEPLDRYESKIASDRHTAATMIAENLEDRGEEACLHLAQLLRWLFSCTGNSICDWSYEIMVEIETLSWDETDFALIMIEEADEIMADVWTGLAWINDHPAMLENLQVNSQKIYKALDKREGDNDEYPDIRLKWSALESST